MQLNHVPMVDSALDFFFSNYKPSETSTECPLLHSFHSIKFAKTCVIMVTSLNQKNRRIATFTKLGNSFKITCLQVKISDSDRPRVALAFSVSS